jgi:hypothetical protein
MAESWAGGSLGLIDSVDHLVGSACHRTFSLMYQTRPYVDKIGFHYFHSSGSRGMRIFDKKPNRLSNAIAISFTVNESLI